MANWRIYLLCRRSGDWDGAEAVLEQMLRRRQMPGGACIALAKICEHRLKDYPRALKYAEQSARYPDGEPPEQLARRVGRIRRKMDEGETKNGII